MNEITWIPAGGTEKANGEWEFDCPSCGKTDGFKLNIDTHKGQCFSCHTGCGTLAGLKGLFGNNGLAVDKPKPKLRKLQAQGEFLPVTQAEEAMRYLFKRRVPPQDVLECGALWCEPRIHFPIWSPFPGQPLMTMARSTLPNDKVRWLSFPGNKEKYLFGKVPSNRTVILTEGIFHVLSSGLWGCSLALLGKVVTTDMVLWLLENFNYITLWLDSHEPSGLRAQELLCEQMAMFARLQSRFKADCYHSIRGVIHTQELGETDPGLVQQILEGKAGKMVRYL